MMRGPGRALGVGATLALAASLLTGCPKKKEEPTAASASAAASTGPVPATTRKAQPPPPDVEGEELIEDLKCGEDGGGNVCRIVREFAEGKKWKPSIPSGRGIWVGKSYELGEPEPEGELIALRAKTVPTSQVGPSDLPLMIGFEPLPDEHHAAGEKLYRALQRGGQGKLTNPALPYLESRFIPRAEHGAMQTEGKSVKLLAGDEIYIRQVSLKKIILVELAAAEPGSNAISGQVAELWSAVW